MGNLSAAMKTELTKATPEVFFVMELSLPGGTKRYAEVGGIVSSTGLYDPRILSWGSFTRGVSLRENSLELFTIDILLDDTDDEFTKLIQGSSANSVRNSEATIKLASPNVVAASWFTVFSGRISSYSQPAPKMWNIQLSPNDLPLQREIVPRTLVTQGDWPDADPAVYGRAVPIAYGKISSASGTGTGAVPTLYVDRTGFVYMIAAGWLKAVDAVYKDGVAVAASNYTITHPTVNGRIYTCIDFTSTQGTSVITADIQGYEPNGDGTGTLIEDPATILAHCLTNWVYADYKSGLFSSATGGMCNTSWSSSYFSDRSYKGCLFISEKAKGLDILNNWLASYDAKAFWKADGTISLAIEDPTSFSYVTDEAAILHEDELGSWNLSFPVADIIDRVDSRYAYAPADGDYIQYLTVEDLQTDEDAAEQIDLLYSPSYIS